MKRSFTLRIFSAILLTAIFYGNAFAISADDFIPPVQEENPAKRSELLAVKDTSTVTTEHDASLDVNFTAASTLQDAINAIVAKPKTGCQFARVAGQSGATVVATGMGTYNPNYENVMASRIEQRNAYVQAFMSAKAEMSKTLSGISFEGATYLERGSQSETNSSRTLNNISASVSERQSQWARAVLKGYVTYAVQDDGKGRVYVTIVSSPKTRGQYSRNGTDGISACSLRDGINSLIAEIRKGLVPPVGGRIIEVPGTGEVAWVGFGSSIVRLDPEPDVQAELELQAEQIAGLRAVDGLAGIIFGDDTTWQGHADEDAKRQVKSFEYMQRDDPSTKGTEQEIKAYENRVREMRSILSHSDTVSSLRRGVLPPGIMRQTDLDEDGYFAYGIAVYLPSASDMAAEVKREMDTTTIVRPVNPNSSNSRNNNGNNNGLTPQRNTNPNAKPELKRGPSGVVEQSL